jgi:CheY-like chemotaxis protein
MVLGLVTDLFFAARIRETAKQLDVPCTIVADAAALQARAADARLVIVDMNWRAGDAAAAVRALKADARTRDVPVLGYLFDAHEDLIQAARAAGCDRVLSRGGLTKRLPELIRALT